MWVIFDANLYKTKKNRTLHKYIELIFHCHFYKAFNFDPLGLDIHIFNFNGEN